MNGTGTHLLLSPSALKGRGGTQPAPPEAVRYGEAGPRSGPERATARRAEGA